MGQDHTQVRLTERGPKVKVVEGEIVESNLDKELFLGRRFEEVDEKGKKVITRKHFHNGLTNSSSDLETKTNIQEPEAVEENEETPAEETEPETTPAVEITTEDDGKEELTIEVETENVNNDEI